MRVAYELQPLTRDSPAVTPPVMTGAPQALLLSDIVAWRLVVEAPEGCTFNGNGILRCWFRHRLTGTWCSSPGFDFLVLSSGVPGIVYADVRQYVQSADLVMFATDGIVLDGTATKPSEINRVKVWLHGEGHR